MIVRIIASARFASGFRPFSSETMDLVARDPSNGSESPHRTG
jgi:hypothetical protein